MLEIDAVSVMQMLTMTMINSSHVTSVESWCIRHAMACMRRSRLIRSGCVMSAELKGQRTLNVASVPLWREPGSQRPFLDSGATWPACSGSQRHSLPPGFDSRSVGDCGESNEDGAGVKGGLHS